MGHGTCVPPHLTSPHLTSPHSSTVHAGAASADSEGGEGGNWGDVTGGPSESATVLREKVKRLEKEVAHLKGGSSSNEVSNRGGLIVNMSVSVSCLCQY